jgi:hypothetical protein
MAFYAPLTFLMLPLLWVGIVSAGYTFGHWAVDQLGWRDAFIVSGSSMLTLGVRFHAGLPSAALSFSQAMLGLGLVALLISYLPTIYGSFSRRELLVGLLETRAGIPPSPYEMLVRYRRIGAFDEIESDLFERWEAWFADIEEGHTNFPALVFFRSPRPQRSWVTAAGCVLDTSALYLSVVDRPFSPRAALCLRSGFLSLREIADIFAIPHDPDPAPDAPISVTRREFDLMCFELEAADVPLRADRDRAWQDFQGWRVNYDQTLVGLADLVMAPEGRWSSDRRAI